MRRKKKCPDVDRELLLSDLELPDELVRARAVGSLCPCHKGWELFEQYVNIVVSANKRQFCRSPRRRFARI
jgi:hypothetical protein